MKQMNTKLYSKTLKEKYRLEHQSIYETNEYETLFENTEGEISLRTSKYL